MDGARQDEVDRLRAELAEWRRRAEVAEAVSAERLARAETAEAALETTRAALSPANAPRIARTSASPTASAPAGTADPAERRPPDEPPAAGEAPVAAGRTLRERWRRYIDSVN